MRWEFRDKSGQAIAVNIEARIICNSAELECSLAVQGVGVTRFPEIVCRRELECGALVPVLQDYSATSIGIYAVYPHRRHLSPKVRAFVDFVNSEFNQTFAG